MARGLPLECTGHSLGLPVWGSQLARWEPTLPLDKKKKNTTPYSFLGEQGHTTGSRSGMGFWHWSAEKDSTATGIPLAGLPLTEKKCQPVDSVLHIKQTDCHSVLRKRCCVVDCEGILLLDDFLNVKYRGWIVNCHVSVDYLCIFFSTCIYLEYLFIEEYIYFYT